jgi:hypothetical protein
VDRRLGEEYDFTRKDRSVHSEIIVPQNAPAWANDRSELWNRVEEAEDKSNRRKSATLAKEMNMALPNAIPRDRQIAMVREFVQENFAAKGLAAQVDFHRGHKADEFKNNHAHVMVATRGFVGDEFGKKVRSIKDKEALYQWRDSWERVVNQELERAKVNERVSARSYQSRSINRIATRHVGRGPDREWRIAENDKIRETNRQVQGLELLEAKLRNERKVLVSERGDLGQRTEEVLKDAERLIEAERDLKIKNKEFGIVVDDLSHKLLITRSGYDKYVRTLTDLLQSMQNANEERLRRLEKLLEQRILKELENRVSRIEDANEGLKEVTRKILTEAVKESFETITATANEFNTTTVASLKDLVKTAKKAQGIINRTAAGWVPKAILGVLILILAGIGWLGWENSNTNETVHNINRGMLQMYEVQETKEKYLAIHPELKAKEAPVDEQKKP